MVTAHIRQTPRCSRCDGTLQRAQDDDGTAVLKCVACGKEHPTSGGGAPTPPADWQATVRDLIAAAVVRWKLASTAKDEAERLCRALAAYGATPPSLPWQGEKTKSTAVDRRFPTPCVLCGHMLRWDSEARATAGRGSPKACKDEAACAARAARAAGNPPA